MIGFTLIKNSFMRRSVMKSWRLYEQRLNKVRHGAGWHF